MDSFKKAAKIVLETIRKHSSFFLSLGVVIALMIYRFQNYIIQQDNYIGYAASLGNGLKDLSFSDSRLYPGLPILIYIVSYITEGYYSAAYLIIIMSFIGTYTLLYKITKSNLSVLPLIFPPVMLDMVTLIANEFVTIFFIILVIYLIFNKKNAYAAFVAGLTYWFRAAGSLIFIAYLVSSYLYQKKKVKLRNLFYFSIPLVFFMIYDWYFFGTLSPFYQLIIYKLVSPYGNAVGFIQMVKDVVRTFDWGQYRILTSGILYIFFYVYFLLRALSVTKNSPNFNNLFLTLSIIFMSIFIFSYSFVPYLENFARYLAPIIPLFWITSYKSFNKKIYVYTALILSILVVVR